MTIVFENIKIGNKYRIQSSEKIYKLWEFKIENDNIKGLQAGKFYRAGKHTTPDFTENVMAKKFYGRPFFGLYLRKQQRLYFSDLKKRPGCDEEEKNRFYELENFNTGIVRISDVMSNVKQGHKKRIKFNALMS